MIKIISYNNTYPRILPLLFNLIKYPIENYELVVLNFKPEFNDIILRDLKLYQSMIKWKLYNVGDNGISIEEIKNTDHLNLIGNIIPVKDSLQKITNNNKTTLGNCYYIKAELALTSDEHSSFIPTDYLNQEPWFGSVIFNVLEQNAYDHQTIGDFICSSEDGILPHNFKYKLIDTNVTNSTMPDK